MTDRSGLPERPGVLVVVGTRPEAIKMAPVVKALRGREPALDIRLALTGQHDEMVDQVLHAFSLTADFDLEIMKEGQDLYDVAHGCLDGLREVVRGFRPRVVLVQGDTATVFFASLVAFLEGVQVGHVEAGLRSGNKWAPFPEEIFRRLSDVLSDLYFAPTPGARQNLLAEGVPEDRIHVTGNTVVDALQSLVHHRRAPRNPVLEKVLAGGGRLVLLTAHRRESFGKPLRDVYSAVRELVDRAPEVQVFYPVHPNPNVSVPAREMLSDHPRIHLTEPIDYLDLLLALRHSSLILTDSGGIQEEAPAFGVPVLVLREVTERPEGIEAGVARLVGTDGEKIVKAALEILAGPRGPKGEGRMANPYGDGKAGERIADLVASETLGIARVTKDWDGA